MGTEGAAQVGRRDHRDSDRLEDGRPREPDHDNDVRELLDRQSELPPIDLRVETAPEEAKVRLERGLVEALQGDLDEEDVDVRGGHDDEAEEERDVRYHHEDDVLPLVARDGWREDEVARVRIARAIERFEGELDDREEVGIQVEERRRQVW